MIGLLAERLRVATTANASPLVFAVVVVCALLWPARGLHAQVLRGVARTAGSERPIERARVVALLIDGRSVGETTTDDDGRFLLRVQARGNVFVVAVTRIGMKPTMSSELMLSPRDTLDVDFSITEEGIVTDTMRVTAAPGLNEIRLREAERRGWRVFPPAEVERIRERVMSFEDLLRSTGYPGLVISPRRDECIRTSRTNKCVLIVVDGVPLGGTYPLINPRDVYFMALLSPNQAMVQFGDRGVNGALQVYTRSRGDRYDERRHREQRHR